MAWRRMALGAVRAATGGARRVPASPAAWQWRAAVPRAVAAPHWRGMCSAPKKTDQEEEVTGAPPTTGASATQEGHAVSESHAFYSMAPSDDGDKGEGQEVTEGTSAHDTQNGEGAANDKESADDDGAANDKETGEGAANDKESAGDDGAATDKKVDEDRGAKSEKRVDDGEAPFSDVPGVGPGTSVFDVLEIVSTTVPPDQELVCDVEMRNSLEDASRPWSVFMCHLLLPALDHEFNAPDFLVGATQVYSVVTELVRRGSWDRLRPMCTPECLKAVRDQWNDHTRTVRKHSLTDSRNGATKFKVVDARVFNAGFITVRQNGVHKAYPSVSVKFDVEVDAPGPHPPKVTHIWNFRNSFGYLPHTLPDIGEILGITGPGDRQYDPIDWQLASMGYPFPCPDDTIVSASGDE